MAEQKKIHIIIDGYSYLYRSYYAFMGNPLINADGQNISSIHAFLQHLLKILDEYNPTSICVAMDFPQPTFRHALYANYKANRQKTPDDFRSQIPILKEILSQARLPMVELPGYEADDIMATLSRQWSGKQDDVWLLTSDKDALQLVNENIHVMFPQKGNSALLDMDSQSTQEKFGVLPTQIVDYLAIIGDSSDNIPGIHGIGDKGARKLLQQYHSLTNIYKNLDAIEPKSLQGKLRDGQTSAWQSHELILLKNDLPLKQQPVPTADLHLISAEVAALLESYGLAKLGRTILDRIGEHPEISANGKAIAPTNKPEVKKRDYKLISTRQEFDLVAKNIINHRGMLAIDTETTSAQPMLAQLLGISLSWQENQAFYLHLDREDGLGFSGLRWPEIAPLLAQALENKELRIVAQNYKYDAIVLRRHGLNLPEPFLDTMLASYILNPGSHRHNLDVLAEQYLGEKTTTYDELTGSGRKRLPLCEVALDKLCNYACEDADITRRLAQLFFSRLTETQLWDFYKDIDEKLIHILIKMEMTGVAISQKHFSNIKNVFHEQINDLTEKIYQIVGRQFNINSTLELQQILFNQFSLPTAKKTKRGYSTDVSVLESLQGKHEIIDFLLEYRKANKLFTTYVTSLPELINPKTKRIHTSFNQTVAATGRLSSSDPNLQNIPIKEKSGQLIRQGFIPQKGWLLLSADYSQIELRVLAHLSQDPTLIDSFTNGLDIHRITAAQIFGIGESDVTIDQRRIGKTINFSVIYGQTPYGLSNQLGIPQSDAKEYIQRYLDQYPQVKAYKEELIAFGLAHKYVQTMFGRRRYITGLDDKNKMRRESAQRMAVNTPIQGSAADIIKKAMISIDSELTKEKLDTVMILQVHDELLFEIPQNEKDIAFELVKKSMEQAVSLRVPLEVQIAYGANWQQAH